MRFIKRILRWCGQKGIRNHCLPEQTPAARRDCCPGAGGLGCSPDAHQGPLPGRRWEPQNTSSGCQCHGERLEVRFLSFRGRRSAASQVWLLTVPFSLGRGRPSPAWFDLLNRDLYPVQFFAWQKPEFLKLPELMSFGTPCGLSAWLGEQPWW